MEKIDDVAVEARRGQLDLASEHIRQGDESWAQGECAEAMESYERAKDLRVEVLGEHHPDVAATLTMMGEAYLSLEEYAKAMECYRQTMAWLMVRRFLGDLT